MLFHHASKNRPFHLGTYPMEVLPRDDSVTAAEAARPPAGPTEAAEAGGALGPAVLHYRELFAGFAEGGPAAETAPVPARLDRRAEDIKGCSYFMDADQVGICRIPGERLAGGPEAAGRPQPCGRHPDRVSGPTEPGQPRPRLGGGGRGRDGRNARAGNRRLHRRPYPPDGLRGPHPPCRRRDASICERLAVLAGTLPACGGWRARQPLYRGRLRARRNLDRTTNWNATARSAPGAARCVQQGVSQGHRRGRLRARARAPGAKRKSHWSRYPMEQVRRVDRPTTLIIDEEVPRVPQRAAFFTRAAKGDLGGKSQARARPLRLQAPALLRPAPAHPRHGAPPGRRSGFGMGQGPLRRPGGECPRGQGALLFPRLRPHGHLRDPALRLVLAPGGRQPR